MHASLSFAPCSCSQYPKIRVTLWSLQFWQYSRTMSLQHVKHVPTIATLLEMDLPSFQSLVYLSTIYDKVLFWERLPILIFRWSIAQSLIDQLSWFMQICKWQETTVHLTYLLFRYDVAAYHESPKSWVSVLVPPKKRWKILWQMHIHSSEWQKLLLYFTGCRTKQWQLSTWFEFYSFNWDYRLTTNHDSFSSKFCSWQRKLAVYLQSSPCIDSCYPFTGPSNTSPVTKTSRLRRDSDQ